MRPRITTREAKYIICVLQREQPLIDAKRERIKELEQEVFRLDKEKVYNHMVILREHLPEKRQQLAELKQEALALYEMVRLHDRLIQKYSLIASGIKAKGRYPRRAMFNPVCKPEEYALELEP